MKNYTKVQRIAIAILIVTEAVSSEELESIGIKKSQADAWAKHLLDKQISFQDAMDIFQNRDTDASINHLLALCIDQRFFTKRPKHDEEAQGEQKKQG
ncbi:hypothetical protein [Pseudoalteromonas pernae]|uniref:hypothetical protein n=1 Tax=Pseudoalteromonas pernae TaxID=3118054 RepID=UPI00324213FA